jgi:hypothetical protein
MQLRVVTIRNAHALQGRAPIQASYSTAANGFYRTCVIDTVDAFDEGEEGPWTSCTSRCLPKAAGHVRAVPAVAETLEVDLERSRGMSSATPSCHNAWTVW